MTATQAKHVFAELMAKARTRTLTDRDRLQLAQARQLLRRGRRPAMNPTRQQIRAEHADVFIHNPQPPGNYREYHAAKHTTPGARKQIAGLMKQGWEFDRTVIYPSGKINFHLLNEGRTAILEEDGKINMLYPVGTKVFDSLKGRDVTQGYGAEPNPLTRRKARTILHEGQVRGRKLTGRQRRFFGARASGSPRRNPSGRMQRIGRAMEVRYQRTIGSQPGYYKHTIKSRKAGVFTIPPGWVYVSTKSILITEKEPRV